MWAGGKEKANTKIDTQRHRGEMSARDSNHSHDVAHSNSKQKYTAPTILNMKKLETFLINCKMVLLTFRLGKN